MKLVLCDDHRILCEALATALEDHGHQVLAVTTTATAGVTAVAAHDPDVCLLDLCFPDVENGLDAARTITQHHPGTKVLVLSGVADPQMLSEAMGIGIAGLLPKDQSVDQIADALDAIAAGGAVFDAGLRHGLTSGLPRSAIQGSAGQAHAEGEGDPGPDRGRREHQADGSGNEHHHRDGQHVRPERAHQTRGAQPVAGRGARAAGRAAEPAETR